MENKEQALQAQQAAYFEDSKRQAQQLESGEAAENAMIRKEAKRLIEESKKFEQSREQTNKKLTKAAFGIAGVSVGLNFLLGIAIVVLTPLQTVIPYVLKVHDGASGPGSSGAVEIMQPLDKSLPSYGETVDRYFITDYVTARESYDWNLMQHNYDKVKSYSDQGGINFREWDGFIKSEKSPLAILKDKGRVDTNIISISLDEKNSVATVRFTKTVMAADGKANINIPPTSWIATLSYEYPNPKLKPSERLLNPLGMKVPTYQLVQEQIRN
ncbi:virB8 family protein (plasmid) [Pseudomonas alloputida]|uniref:virB8 family protein n=1 Tax=Pseudomonas alloputida TaxID=1940621 RepID=UPI003B437A86